MKPKKTTIPGLKDTHRVVSATCLENRGVDGCIEEVMVDVRKSIEGFSKNGWPREGGKLHIVTIVERPCDGEEEHE